MTKQEAEQANGKALLNACMRGDTIARAELAERQARVRHAESLFPAFQRRWEARQAAKQEG
jgi:hypothetical protein